jgi:hypothetical protein
MRSSPQHGERPIELPLCHRHGAGVGRADGQRHDNPAPPPGHVDRSQGAVQACKQPATSVLYLPLAAKTLSPVCNDRKFGIESGIVMPEQG